MEEAALYREHADRVFGYLVRMLGSRDEAEDALQETFLKALRGLRRGVHPRIPQAWLLTIAHNVCVSRFRARRDAVAIEEMDELPARAEPVHGELFALSEALAALPETQRRALVLREWCGLSYDEIAGELALSYSAAAAQVFRGRNALAARLTGPAPPAGGTVSGGLRSAAR